MTGKISKMWDSSRGGNKESVRTCVWVKSDGITGYMGHSYSSFSIRPSDCIADARDDEGGVREG